MQYRKDHQLFFSESLVSRLFVLQLILRCTLAIVVKGCILPSIIRFEPYRHEFHSLLNILDVGVCEETCNNGDSVKTTDAFFDDFISAAWFL